MMILIVSMILTLILLKAELIGNKHFKIKNYSDLMQSGIKIYTNMDKDVQKRFKIALIMVITIK